jgi:hypothetical protein
VFSFPVVCKGQWQVEIVKGDGTDGWVAVAGWQWDRRVCRLSAVILVYHTSCGSGWVAVEGVIAVAVAVTGWQWYRWIPGMIAVILVCFGRQTALF